MQLIAYLKTHRQELNLAQISRRAGLDSSYLKHVVANRLDMSEESEKRIQLVLLEMGIATLPENRTGFEKGERT